MNDKLIGRMKHSRAAALDAVAKFRAELEKDPAYAMEWGDGAVEMAARAKVYTEALQTLTADKIPPEERLPHLLKWLRQEVGSAARSPKRSTSVMANLMHQQVLAARADLLENLDSGWWS